MTFLTLSPAAPPRSSEAAMYWLRWRTMGTIKLLLSLFHVVSFWVGFSYGCIKSNLTLLDQRLCGSGVYVCAAFFSSCWGRSWISKIGLFICLNTKMSSLSGLCQFMDCSWNLFYWNCFYVFVRLEPSFMISDCFLVNFNLMVIENFQFHFHFSSMTTTKSKVMKRVWCLHPLPRLSGDIATFQFHKF